MAQTALIATVVSEIKLRSQLFTSAEKLRDGFLLNYNREFSKVPQS